MKNGFSALLLLLAVGSGYWLYQDGMKKERAEDLELTSEEYQDGRIRAEKIAEKVLPEIERKLADTKISQPAVLSEDETDPTSVPVPPDPPAPTIEWKPGAPVFIRIFKEERELELWLKDGEIFRLFETYPVVAMSGKPGPKLAEGDRQAPEGFYFVPPSAMKPDSAYHLAFNLGYPNSYDRSLGRTGSFIMVHGSNASVGCFAMTDAKIEEIYTLCTAALEGGQPFFRVHVFPFRMTDEKMSENSGSEWFSFWQNLKEGYDWFDKNGVPPDVSIRDSTYLFSRN